ncbi:MAG: sugar isomerase domain-containing protein [Erysipelotrichaceae bacterium]|nr:sugar isomerase domain-containing protein [Erysipelotrichaceae bacterium]
MNNKVRDYFQLAHQNLDLIVRENEDKIHQAAVMFKQCMDNNGVVQLFGVKHGLGFAMELGYRAGGLMPFHKMNVNDLVMKGKLTQKEYEDPAVYDDLSVADKLLENYNIYDEDMYAIASDTGCEAVVVEVALKAREKGQKVLAVINQKAADANESRHPSGKKLQDVADLTIDTLAPYPDVNVEVEPGVKMAALNTYNGNIIAQCITAEAYDLYQQANEDCPILLSQNLAGADVHNKLISDKYEGRWNS